MPPGTRFIGRDSELTALRASLDRALAGEGSCVFIEGEPGIGKSSLARRLTSEAASRGACVASSRCREQSGSPKYWPFIQAFESCEIETGRELAGLLAGRLDTREPTGPGVLERVRFELHDAASRTLARIARQRPLLIVIDDLHWSDDGSLELLAFVARELSELPLLVIGTFRTGTDERLAGLASLGHVLRLTGLSVVETAVLLERKPGREVDLALAEQVHAITSGNPFFVLEVARLLDASCDSDAALPANLPSQAKEAFSRRLSAISAPSRRVLQTAAVLGLEFSLASLARAIGESSSAVSERLEEPRAAGLVQMLAGPRRRYAFSHALVRDAFYESLGIEQRAAQHLSVARSLESASRDRRSDLAFELSHHYFEATLVSDPAPAIRYACEAGEHALERLAFEQAQLQFGRALAAIEQADSVAPEDRVHALIGYGVACGWNGGLDAAASSLREGLHCARSLGPVAFAKTVLRVALSRAEFQILDVETNDLLSEALRGLPETPSGLRARLLARLSSGLHLQPGSEELRLAMSRSAIEMARELDDSDTSSFVRSRCLATLLTPDHAVERAQTIAEILDDPATSPESELEARLFQLHDLAQGADRKGLDTAIGVFDQKVKQAGLHYFRWQVAINRAALALLEGRFSEAEPLAVAALQEGQRVAPQSAGLRFAAQLSWLRSWQGRLHEVTPLVESSVELTQLVPAWRAALAGLFIHSNRVVEARREFEALAANEFRDLPRDSTWLLSVTLLADVCVRLEDQARAAILYEWLRPHAGQIAVATPVIVLHGLCDIRLAALARLLGRYDAAIAHCERAIGTAERMRALPWQAEARYQLALALAGAGDLSRALELLIEAEEIARPVGMLALTSWVVEARTGLQRAGARVLADTGTGGRRHSLASNLVHLPVARGSAPGATFRREGEVWTLALDGAPSRFKDMRGLAHIARLLAEPGREFHVSDLAGTLSVPSIGDAGERLDARSRREYEARLRELKDELEEAKRLNDMGRGDQCAQEIEWLTGQLAHGFGLGGRERRDGSASERARQSVTRAIKYAIDKIEKHDAVLADHLRRNVTTGTFCKYAPSSREPVSWKL